MEEDHQEREEYNNERRETRQSQMEEREDGTTLILTEAKSESKQAFSSLSQNSQRFEHTETTVTGAETSASEAADLKTGANDTTSEQGFEDQYPHPSSEMRELQLEQQLSLMKLVKTSIEPIQLKTMQ